MLVLRRLGRKPHPTVLGEPFSKLLLLFWVAWVILLWSFPAPAARVIIRHLDDPGLHLGQRTNV
ncbi:MAG TPA: hypothetical protein VK101_06200 [Limnochordia bacterium]|nr:hypothetical protein [Limnochordia bacterium]